MGCGSSTPTGSEAGGAAGVGATVSHAMRLGEDGDGSNNTIGNTIGNYVIDQSSPTIDSASKPVAVVYPKPESVREVIRAALKKNFIFQALAPSDVEKLVDVFSPQSCAAGDNVIVQGAPGDYMYAIESGRFDVFKNSEASDGAESKIAEMTNGQTFGELALLYGAKRSATVRCVEPASLWALDRATFRHYRASNERRMKTMAVGILGKVSLLKDLEPEQLRKATEVARTEDHLEGDVIIHKGDMGSTFYVILEGVVLITEASLGDGDDVGASGDSMSPDSSMGTSLPDPSAGAAAAASESHPVAAKALSKSYSKVKGGIRLKAGEWFGEIALLNDGKRTANVLADSSVRLLVFDRDSFEQVLGPLRDLLDRKANMRLLAGVPLIAKLPLKEREVAFDLFATVAFQAGQTIVKEGDVESKFFLMRAGSALVHSKSGGGEGIASSSSSSSPTKKKAAITPEPSGSPPPIVARHSPRTTAAASSGANMPTGEPMDLDLTHLGKLVREISAGDHFGEEALLQNHHHDATITAKTDVSCFVLERRDFAAVVAEYEAAVAGTEGGQLSALKAEATQQAPKVEIDWGCLKNLGKIGAGTFGTVLMMQDTRTLETYAMKVLDRQRVKKMRQEKRLETEKALLREMNSPFICRMVADTEDDFAFYLLLELVQGGELQRLIHPQDPQKRAKQQQEVDRGLLAGIPHQPAKFYCAAVSLPLNYIHKQQVAFRDLKPENVMIDRNGYPKLIDFGLAKPLELTGGKTYTLCGTPEYLAPEVILGTGHNQAADWWALGVLLFEMVVGASPFLQKGVERRKQDHMAIFENIVDGRILYPAALEPGCKDLLKRLMTHKPAIRMSSGRRGHKEFEAHAWFQSEVDWALLEKCQLQPPWYPPIANATDQVCFKKEKS